MAVSYSTYVNLPVEDLDGNLWDVFHMSGLPPQPE